MNYISDSSLPYSVPASSALLFFLFFVFGFRLSALTTRASSPRKRNLTSFEISKTFFKIFRKGRLKVGIKVPRCGDAFICFLSKNLHQPSPSYILQIFAERLTKFNTLFSMGVLIKFRNNDTPNAGGGGI